MAKFSKSEIQAIDDCLSFGIRQVDDNYLHGPHLQTPNKKRYRAAKRALRKIRRMSMEDRIEFEMAHGGGWHVNLRGRDGKPILIGYIDKERRFFQDPTTIKTFVELTAADLRKIADKVDES